MDDSADVFGLLSKRDFVGGPVPCVSLRFLSEGICVFGRGPYVVTSNIWKAGLVPNNEEDKLLVFRNPGQNVHGICFSENNNKLVTTFGVVHGGRQIAFVQTCNTRQEDSGKTTKLKTVLVSGKENALYESLGLGDWVWDILLIESESVNETAQFHLCVGLAHNVVEVWKVGVVSEKHEDVIEASLIHRYQGTRRCISYSLSFWYDRGGTDDKNVEVAVGTVTNEILLLSFPIKNQKNPTNQSTQETILEHQVLEGHKGVIHAVLFNEAGNFLASASDDRSIRLWGKSLASIDGMYGEEWPCLWVGWGHTARCWNVAFCDSLGVLLSCSEDGSVRMWSTDSGEQTGIFRGPAGGSYWSVDCSKGSIAVAGGNDGTVHLFDTSIWLEQKDTISFQGLEHAGRCRRVFNVPDDRIVTPESQDDEQESIADVTPIKKKKKKIKTTQQILVGVEFVSNQQTICELIRVATRSGSLMELNLRDNEWCDQTAWWQIVLNTSNVQPVHGCCMASHVDGTTYAIGTTQGKIVLCRGSERAVLDGSQYRAIQRLVWTNANCLMAYHVQAVRCWDFGAASDEETLTGTSALVKTTTYLVGNKAVVTSAAFDTEMDRLVVGDSRGTLSLFKVPDAPSPEDVLPCSSLPRLHRKEHVNDIVWTSSRIISVGNDGYLRDTRVERGCELFPFLSIPVRAFTGIDRIWVTSQHHNDPLKHIALGGYTGNEYAIIDFRTGYEFFRTDTGGRGRTMTVAQNMWEAGRVLASVNAGRKDGLNDLIVESQPLLFSDPGSGRQIKFFLGTKLHDETLFDVDFGRLSQDRVALVSASEDCSSRLTVWDTNDNSLGEIPFPSQESGVRAVCCSSLSDTGGLFVVEGGAKLVLRFYVVQPESTGGVSLRYVGEGSPIQNSTIDHRINSVKAALVEDDGKQFHVALAGDSNGQVYAYRVQGDYDGRISGQLVFEDERPVFSLEILKCTPSQCCVLVGTSGGDICIVDLSRFINQKDKKMEHGSCIIHRFNGHSVGTNCIAAVHITESLSAVSYRVASGGDDQSICSFHIDLHFDGNSVSVAISNLIKRQRLAVWKIESSCFKLVSVMDVEVGDVNSLAAISTGTHYLVAVAGIGAQLFTFSPSSATSS